MYQSGRAGDKAKKRKSPAKSGRELASLEICYTNIVVSGHILNMRSEDTLLEK